MPTLQSANFFLSLTYTSVQPAVQAIYKDTGKTALEENHKERGAATEGVGVWSNVQFTTRGVCMGIL